MNVHELKNRHQGRPGFCLGTAPHLNHLDLSLLKDQVTIGCNQLILRADELNLDYICFQREERFKQARPSLPKTKHSNYIIPESFIDGDDGNDLTKTMEDRIVPIHTRFATPGHAEFFSFDLENCVYAGDSIAIEIQLAAWMGCNPIYVLGVDAGYQNPEHPYFDGTAVEAEIAEKSRKYFFPDLKEWLSKVRVRLWSRGVKLLNAAGEQSSLDTLPRIRLAAAVGKPKIAVTSKTFSKDEYLVSELGRYFNQISLNDSKEALKGANLIEFLSDADGIILGTEPFGADIIESLPCLRYVAKYGVGLNNIDFDAAKRCQMEISYKKGVNSDSVAELAMAFALMLLRRIDDSIQGYRKGKWRKLPGRELAEITVGIIGYGHVGRVVAKKFAALGVGRLLVNDLLDFPAAPPVEFVPLDYLLTESDIVTVHVDAEKRNRHLVDDEFIARMKDGAMLINTSRGTVVDESALATALKNGKLYAAALDVYENEPEMNPEFQPLPNLLTTCHIAGSSNRAIKNMGWASIEGLLQLFGMKPI